MLCVFLDEFGHDGFYSADIQQYCHSPVFGLGGIVLPGNNVLEVVSRYRALKEYYFKTTDDEVKGNRAFPPIKEGMNGSDRRRIIKLAFRLLAIVRDAGGKIIFSGIEKYSDQKDHKPKVLHNTHSRRCISIINRQLRKTDGEHFMVVFDEHKNHAYKIEYIRSCCQKNMDGSYVESGNLMIEPPFQGDSVIYNTIQAADWICALLMRVFSYISEPDHKTFCANKEYYEKILSIIYQLKFDGSILKFKSGKNLANPQFHAAYRAPFQANLPFD